MIDLEKKRLIDIANEVETSFEALLILQAIDVLMRAKISEQPDKSVTWTGVDYFPSVNSQEVIIEGLTKCEVRDVSGIITTQSETGESTISKYLGTDDIRFSLSEVPNTTDEQAELYQLEVILLDTFLKGGQVHFFVKTESGQKIISTFHLGEPVGKGLDTTLPQELLDKRQVLERDFLTRRMTTLLSILNQWLSTQQAKSSFNINQILEMNIEGSTSFNKKASTWVALLELDLKRLMELNQEFMNDQRMHEVETTAVAQAQAFLSKSTAAWKA